jgi:Zn-dependent protease with chaperone function
MTATADEFRKLDALYAEQPAAYKRKVVGLISLGYLYIFFAISLMAGFVIGGSLLFAAGMLPYLLLIKFIQFGLPAVIIAGVLFRSVFVSIPKPQGVYLDSSLKKHVLQYFEDLRREVGGCRVDDVVITDEFNAAVQQLPRLGLVGPARTYLILGAPLLQLMTPTEARAVVAHEFGHLSREHGRMGALVYRLDQTLVRAVQSIEATSRSGLFGMSFRIVASFYERFSTVTFAMRRGQEHEADAAAADATSAQSLASALCRLMAVSGPLQEYWSDIWSRPRDTAENSTVSPHASMHDGVTDHLGTAESRVAIRRAMEIETDYIDTHPALKDRLAALEQEPVTDFEADGNALADIFDADTCGQLLSLLDAAWRAGTAEFWKQASKDFEQAREEMKGLRERRESLDAAELLNLAALEEHVDGMDAARGTYRQLLEKHPHDAHANFHWGRIHLQSDFAIAEPALLKSAELELELAGAVGPLLELGYEAAGRRSEFEKFRDTLGRFEAMCNAAAEERGTVTAGDEFTVPDLGEAMLAAIRESAGQCRRLERLYLVEKPAQHFRRERIFVLGLYFNMGFDSDEEVSLRAAQLMQELCDTFPDLGLPFCVLLNSDAQWSDRLKDIDGALVFDKSEKHGPKSQGNVDQSTEPRGQSAGTRSVVFRILAAVVVVLGGFTLVDQATMDGPIPSIMHYLMGVLVVALFAEYAVTGRSRILEMLKLQDRQ